jgi:serine/threonine-protein kinase
MTTPSEWQRVEGALDELLALSEPERQIELQRIALEDVELHRQLESLLAHVDGDDALLDAPAIEAFSAHDAADAGLRAGDRIGPYRLLRELGHGGMGVVWLAERADGLFQRPVALKLPTLALPQRILAERFAREREILAPLVHPNIARLYDAGFAADGQPYLALEYVEGASITSSCDAAHADIRSRIELFLQVLAAVEYAHKNLVLHRDLKPSNILVTPEKSVKLLDFGIAKLMEEGNAASTELTRLSGHALTLDYASPEQAVGAPLTTAADVYSLGVVLYELLAGQRPYKLKRGTRGELEQAIAAADPQPPSRSVTCDSAAARGATLAKVKRALAGDLDTIALKALHKAPEQRYASVAALADDLRRHLAGMTILARPASGWSRAVRFARRNALVVSATAVVAIALIGASIVSWVLMQRAERAAVEARNEATIATAVQNFMTDLFRANTVDQNLDKPLRDLTAAELLDRGALSIDHSLDDAPAAKASLLELFGEMYEELGLIDRSLAMHDKSVAAAAKAYGEDSREYALALLEKAWVTNLSDKTSAAPRTMAEQAKRILAVRAPGSEDYAEALYMEAHMLLGTDTSRAVADAEESVGIMERLGAHDKRAAFAKQELGYVYRYQGNLAGAVQATNTAIGDFQHLYGPDHLNVAYLREGLALMLFQQLRLSEAENEFRAAIAIQEKYPFYRRTTTRAYRLQLAQLIAARGHYDEAYAQMDSIEAESRASTDSAGLVASHIPVVRSLSRIWHGDTEHALAELTAASADTTPFAPRALVSTSLLYEYFARAYLLAGDVPHARDAVDRARAIVAKEGTLPTRQFSLALRDAEVLAQEGHAERALETIDSAEKAYGIGRTAPDTRANIALTRARAQVVSGQGEAAIATLAPWLDKPLDAGVELPAATRAEMLLLSGEALALSNSVPARERLREAEAALRVNDIASSPRLARVHADLAWLSH